MNFILLCLLPFITFQEDATQELSGGPIIDSIVKRIDKRSESIEKTVMELTGRFNPIMEALRTAKNERRGLLSELAEIRRERQSILDAISELRADRAQFGNLREFIKEGRETRAEFRRSLAENLKNTNSLMGQWTPLANLVDRLNKLLLKMLLTVGLVGLLGFIVLAILGRLYFKLKKVVPGI